MWRRYNQLFSGSGRESKTTRPGCLFSHICAHFPRIMKIFKESPYFVVLQCWKKKKKLRIALSQLLTGLVVAGGLQSRREGWGGDEGWGSLGRMLFKPEMAQEQVHPGTPITQRSPGNGSLKPVWEKSSLSGQKVQFRTDLFSSFSPSSTCSLIHLWQLQSSPAMKGSDPKFYFSHGDAWHLSETYASTGDNDLCSAG